MMKKKQCHPSKDHIAQVTANLGFSHHQPYKAWSLSHYIKIPVKLEFCIILSAHGQQLLPFLMLHLTAQNMKCKYIPILHATKGDTYQGG